jgi:hypothetical protein
VAPEHFALADQLGRKLRRAAAFAGGAPQYQRIAAIFDQGLRIP